MPAVRARIVTVLEKISQELLKDARAASQNGVLSRVEQERMAPGLLKGAADDARDFESHGGRVTAQEVADRARASIEAHIKQINQATGAGASILSQEEIKRLQGVNPETAARAARAYELITGKRVILDGVVPQDPTSGLPDRARVALVDGLVDHFGLARAARLDITDVSARDGGYDLKVNSNVFQGALFAREVDGRFFFASTTFDASTVRLVADQALAYFDDSFKADMESWGASATEIADARTKFVPKRFLLAGEDDPWSYATTYPLVIQIDNQTGSDHGVYAGVNPATGEVDIYSFN